LSPRFDDSNEISNSAVSLVGNFNKKGFEPLSKSRIFETQADVKSEFLNSSYGTQSVDINDRYVNSVFEKERAELFPEYALDLGPKTTTIHLNRRLRKSNSDITRDTKPEGSIVATFAEHKSAVNKIALASDHMFFASSSRDGTIKIWDTQKLQKNVSNRSRLTYIRHEDSEVTALGFCHGYHSLISASKSGQLHISRIEYIKSSPKPVQYMNWSTLHEIFLENGDFVTHLDQYDTGHSSLLAYTTARGNFGAYDLRTMKIVWETQANTTHGRISSFTRDARGFWAVTGTHRGVLTLWDLRYRIPVHSWRHPSRRKINQISLYPSKFQNDSKLISIGVENELSEISTWDVETKTCSDLWCIYGEKNLSDLNQVFGRIYGNFQPVEPPSVSEVLSETNLIEKPNNGKLKRFHCFDYQENSMYTGGYDQDIRFCDLDSPNKSFTISSAEKYMATTTMSYQNVKVNTEYSVKDQYNRAETGLDARKGILTSIGVTKSPFTMVIAGSHDGIIQVWK
jgi:phosphoinositide-3-kinase regulatory subunit 4